MTPQKFQYLRREMLLSRNELAVLLGYGMADPKQGYVNVKRMELGKRPISPMCARLLTMIHRHWSSTGDLPEFENV